MSANVSDLLRRRAEDSADAVALVEAFGDGRTATWAELDATVDAIARGLSGRGLVAGHRVGIVMPNTIAFVATYLAAHRAGVVAVPVNPRAAAGEVMRLVADAGLRLVVAGGPAAALVRGALGDEAPPVVVHDAEPVDGETAWEVLARTPGEGVPPSPADPEILATLLYTSGTAGTPRGVMLSHRALLANVDQVSRIDPPVMAADDVVLGLLPLFHVYGLSCVLGQVLATGARLVLVDRFDVDGTLAVVRDHGVTNVPLAPPVAAAWVGRDDLRESFAAVRTVLSGASPLDPDLAAEFAASAGVVIEQGYGLTEASPVVAATPATPGRDRTQPPRPSSVGHSVADLHLRIVDVSGRDAHRGDPGEIWLQGPNLFSGYWPDGVDGPDADGWWGTGDVGLIGDDGDLVLVDRLQELVIVSGFNVYPREVEEVLGELDEVAEVAVIGVADTRTGEAVSAYVVAAEGAEREAVLAAIGAQCEQRLARYKWPRDVEVVDSLPHSATGKVAKGRLRARVRAGELGLS
ncbi:class I adenylate-forming enzyme family protein [Solicola sp. PLA-1-18]|uniref:class I adenylate-forming enzyme family protein n=1 Tax=Solicola sp. PLA-1-18 TaxID=3380532 RepID=UPI003B7FEEFD